MIKTSFNQFLRFSWENSEPRWRMEFSRKAQEIAEDTGLSVDELELVLLSLQHYNILSE